MGKKSVMLVSSLEPLTERTEAVQEFLKDCKEDQKVQWVSKSRKYKGQTLTGTVVVFPNGKPYAKIAVKSEKTLKILRKDPQDLTRCEPERRRLGERPIDRL